MIENNPLAISYDGNAEESTVSYPVNKGGRPKSKKHELKLGDYEIFSQKRRKKRTTIYLDVDTINYFRANYKHYQTALSEGLRQYVLEDRARREMKQELQQIIREELINIMKEIMYNKQFLKKLYEEGNV